MTIRNAHHRWPRCCSAAALSASALSLACGGVAEQPGDGVDFGEVGTQSEELSAYRDSLWIAPEGQLVTNIYYCYETDVDPDVDAWEFFAGIVTVDQALIDTWELTANVDFIFDGWCDSSPNASDAVHIKVTDATSVNPTGRDVAGVTDGMKLKFDTDKVDAHCGGLDYATCVRHQAVHEFGHVLGFGHESERSDAVGCTRPQDPPFPVEFITEYDPDSIEETSYCRDVDEDTSLSDLDVIGVRAVYGSGDTFCNAPRTCVHAEYGEQSALRFRNGTYLQPRSPSSGDGVMTQDFVGTWERLRFEKVSGASGNNIHYGDVVAIKDRWDKYLRGRSDNEVDKQTYVGSWEKWVVESPNPSLYLGSVLTNAPIRLRSQRWGTYLYIRSGRDVELTSGTSGTELRIHGPFLDL